MAKLTGPQQISLLEPSHAPALNYSEQRLPRAKLRGEVSFWLFLSKSVAPTTATFVPTKPCPDSGS